MSEKYMRDFSEALDIIQPNRLMSYNNFVELARARIERLKYSAQ